MGGTSSLGPNEHPSGFMQTSAMAGVQQTAPIQEQLALELQVRPDHNTGSGLTPPFGPYPDDMAAEEGPTTGGPDVPMAHFASTAMDDPVPACNGPWPVIWDGPGDLDWTSWLTGADFDLDALNQSLLESTELRAHDAARTGGGAPGPVQRRWHTFSETAISSGQTTPDRGDPSTNDPGQIRIFADESYRQRLAESLRQRIQPGILPSTGFLNLCLQAYFTHFQSIFPLLHVPTFQPSQNNAILLLSICSIGSLFLGSERAMTHGISMFERMQKAILASWETHISARKGLSIISLQAALIGQTFGLLVGRPKDLTGIDIFHGSIVAWARKARLFNLADDPRAHLINIDDNYEELEGAWRSWARNEEKKRIVLGIYIHDVEVAKLHNHEPILRHGVEKVPKLSPPNVFMAPNAAAWKRELISIRTPVHIPPSPADTDPLSLSVETGQGDDFESYATLESIGALAHENRDSGGTRPAIVQNCQKLLTQWYLRRVNHDPRSTLHANRTQDPFCLMILWHSTFMHLYTRFDDLECACGREGETVSQQKRPYAEAWVRSVDAKRTLLHAALVQRHFQSIAVGAEPAVHVPMALYYCGIAWASFTQFRINEPPIDGDSEDLDFPELRMLGINQTKLFCEVTRGIQLGRLESGPLFIIIDLLGKISHWKIAQNLSATLLAFVENLPDLF
ncbi:hypothetical protein ABOM_005614 [Aspergillus bombycis]|uniref:Xylanolytic transcriptional activator regulatory domain-containing protein n=1 Tax=Aspergillus bombycis TaxID=109264 RepID=A0A1F8A0S4_9EURO|nr:hypothetical protein ABOM_005614 [Aspergillus bombycis]OGM45332.1 hypothetical protein ABOM_005614 [Aspergillus bombycis]